MKYFTIDNDFPGENSVSGSRLKPREANRFSPFIQKRTIITVVTVEPERLFYQKIVKQKNRLKTELHKKGRSGRPPHI